MVVSTPVSSKAYGCTRYGTTDKTSAAGGTTTSYKIYGHVCTTSNLNIRITITAAAWKAL